MVQIQPLYRAGIEVHFVEASFVNNKIEYTLFNNDKSEERTGTLENDGTITEENALQNALSSLGAQLLENGTE